MKPSAHLLQALSRSRLLVRGAVASTGIGERRSRKVGSGMDFADYREYAPGDETRHLDARLHARLGSFHIRQFEVDMQLPITIVVDGSRSMRGAAPDKLTMALWMAEVLGYVGLQSSDQVRVAVWTGETLNISRRMSGVNRQRDLAEWLLRPQTSGSLPFETAFAQLADTLPKRGLLTLISDFWIDGVGKKLAPLAATESELWALQILTPHEVEPAITSRSEVTVIDSETGDTVAIAIDQATLSGYRQLFQQHQHELAECLAGFAGRHHLVMTNSDLESFVLNDMRAQGMLHRL